MKNVYQIKNDNKENHFLVFSHSYLVFGQSNDIKLECESWNLNLKLYLRPGASSHDCILRSLCEVARTPQNQDGLFGDFINLLLAPSYILDQPSESFKDSDYLEAQRTGHFLQDCSRYERSCPMSLFEVRIFNFQYYLRAHGIKPSNNESCFPQFFSVWALELENKLLI